jgi:TolB-like protein/predicted Zn-dependent protease
MSETTKAVFLSYASQDAEAAKRIADALRGAGIEVWFDQSELVGGDAWDAKIRHQISSCALFVPIVSGNTQARLEGYFRLEWKLAAQRTHTMADEKTFLLPVVIDDTKDAVAKVPQEFKAVQWTKLQDGESMPAFVTRVKKLLVGEQEAGHPRSTAEATSAEPKPRNSGLGRLWWALPILGATVALIVIFRQQPPAAVTRESLVSAAPAELPPARQLARRALQLRTLNGLSRERLGVADDLVNQAFKIDPTEPETWAAAAQIDALMIYREWDNSDARRQSAAKRVSRALALAPDGFESRRAQAMLSGFVVGTEEAKAEAETAFRGLLREQPDNPDLLEEWGRFLQDRRRFDEAIEAYQRAGLPVRVGAVYATAGRYEEARRIADGLLAKKSTSEALILKANVELFGFNDRAAAKAAVRQLTPTELREDDAAGTALRLAVLSSDAPGLLKLLEAFPHPFVSILGVSYPRQYWTGFARLIQHQPEAAKIEWRGALQSIEEEMKAKPDNAFMLTWAALLYAHLGDRENAEKTLRLYRNFQAVDESEWDWNDCLTLLQLGDRNAEVINRLEKTLRRPSSPFTRIVYAWARFSPEFDSVRGDARFEKLLRERRWKEALPFDDEKEVIAAAVGPDGKSIAVLAFADLSEKHDSEYFSDGISEELLNVLAKVPGLKVSARTSAFYFKGKDVPIPEIARQLGVAYVVEGSVRKAGDKVRITAQLIKAADGFHVWSDTFTRDLKDIFAVQDEIAGLIAGNLSLKLGMATAGAPVNPEAFALLLQGRFLARQERNAGREKSIELYRRAIELEPRYALAWAEIAQSYVRLARFGGLPTAEGMREARLAAQEALSIDPDQPVALDALGWVQRTADWNWKGAQKTFDRALSLAPENSAILTGASILYFNVGRIEEALAFARKAVDRDPLNPMAQINYGDLLINAGQMAEGVGIMRQGLTLAPGAEEFPAHLAVGLARLKRTAEADAMLEQEPSESYRLWGRGIIAGIQGDLPGVARAREALVARRDPTMDGYVAMLFVAEKKPDEAFLWMDRTVRERDSTVCWVKNTSFYDGVMGDSRWNDFLRRIGLSDEQLK